MPIKEIYRSPSGHRPTSMLARSSSRWCSLHRAPHPHICLPHLLLLPSSTLTALILQLVVDHSPPDPHCSPHGQLGSLSSPSACPGDSSSAGCQCVPTHCAGTCAGPRCCHPALLVPAAKALGGSHALWLQGKSKGGKRQVLRSGFALHFFFPW